jgi:hypothetical protein
VGDGDWRTAGGAIGERPNGLGPRVSRFGRLGRVGDGTVGRPVE